MALYWVVETSFSAYTLLLSVAIISSWFPELEEFAIIRYVRFCTEPYLALFRRWIPPLGVIDISPIAAFIMLKIVAGIILGMLV